MSSLLIGFIGVLVATNQPAAVSNLVTQTTGMVVKMPDPDPLEQELKQLMEDDQNAMDEVDGWIRENQRFNEKGAGIPAAEMRARIHKRFEPIHQAYQDFIKRHPDFVHARTAYASFLDDIGDESGEQEQLEKARQLDPKDPAIWNNLANYYGHNGPVTNAFIYYEKAIELNPAEPVYYQNFATTVYLFRKDATAHYRITEQQVFDKALGLYTQALRLDPTNFALATDLAQTYYGIRPVRPEDALRAWTNALHLAGGEVEREGVYIHLARFKYNDGKFAEAQAHLDAVTNAIYAELKKRLLRNLAEKEKEADATNHPAATHPGKSTNAQGP